MCGIHSAGVEILGVSTSAVTPTLTAIGVVAFLTLTLLLMRVDSYRGGR